MLDKQVSTYFWPWSVAAVLTAKKMFIGPIRTRVIILCIAGGVLYDGSDAVHLHDRLSVLCLAVSCSAKPVVLYSWLDGRKEGMEGRDR